MPVVEAGAEAAGDRLRVAGAVVVAEAVVGEAQGLREQPAFAVVLGEKCADAALAVAAGGCNPGFEIVEGNEREHGVAEFRGLVSVDTPESFRIEGLASVAVRAWQRRVTIFQDGVQVEEVESIRTCDHGVEDDPESESFLIGQCGLRRPDERSVRRFQQVTQTANRIDVIGAGQQRGLLKDKQTCVQPGKPNANGEFIGK